jgi:signal peptidase I
MLAIARVAPRAAPCTTLRLAAHASRTASRGAALIPRRPLAGRARRPKRRGPAKPPPHKAPETSKPPPWAGWWKDEAPPDGESVGRTLWGLAKFGLYFYGVTTYVVDLTLCTGPSMEPTLNANSDLVLLDRVSPRLGRIATGDIVVADSPTRPGETVCKRVSAVAGERIPGSFFADVVPPGCVWLLGDNRRNSTDSRIYGPVPTDVIKGRVVLRVWPLDQARFFI